MIVIIYSCIHGFHLEIFVTERCGTYTTAPPTYSLNDTLMYKYNDQVWELNLRLLTLRLIMLYSTSNVIMYIYMHVWTHVATMIPLASSQVPMPPPPPKSNSATLVQSCYRDSAG